MANRHDYRQHWCDFGVITWNALLEKSAFLFKVIKSGPYKDILAFDRNQWSRTAHPAD